jgi:protein involved in polysaccharide export with SLBB domain
MAPLLPIRVFDREHQVMKSIVIAATVSLSLAGCIAFDKPDNRYDLGGAEGYMAQRRDIPSDVKGDAASARAENEARCLDPQPLATNPSVVTEVPLSAGDLVRINVSGDEAPTGTYKVNSNGILALVGVGDLPVTGLTVAEAEADLERLLESKHIFRHGFGHASVRILDRGPARVIVTGAVFQAGQVVINENAPKDTDTIRETAIGDHAIGRTLSIALSHAGGVRPDADLAHITIEHAGQRRIVDLTGILTGQSTDDPVLSENDRVVVPSRHCFQQALARPTPITPPGIKVFLSNLTTPAASNASSAIGQDSTSLPYGTRFLQALVSANCVGGTQITNADRWGVLITTNPMTGDSEVVERQIEALVRRRDRDAYNPVLLQGDAVACYDSNVQNVRDVLKSIGDAALGATVGQSLGGL